MQIGDKLTVTPEIEGALCEPMEAHVIFIHPERRYYTVEYRGRNGMLFRESFPFPDRRGNEKKGRTL